MTRAYWLSTLARVFCGSVFLAHGIPKILSLEGTRMFFEGVGIPGWMAVPIALLETIGGAFLVAGLLTRIVAGLFVIEMLVAALFVHLSKGWDVFQGGVEFNLALILLLLAPILLGVGPLSTDDAVGLRRKKPEIPRVA